jgi:hypothetical protein
LQTFYRYRYGIFFAVSYICNTPKKDFRLKKNTEQDLKDLFKERFAEEVTFTEMLPPSGSYREYIRMKSFHFTAMGTWNEDEKENRAFINFYKNFSR